MDDDGPRTRFWNRWLALVDVTMKPPIPAPLRRVGPLLEPRPGWRDTKDPCPVLVADEWHLFGSGGSVIVESWEILHATAPALKGPWQVRAPAHLAGVRSERVAAPGVLNDGDRLHMFVQTDFMSPGGTLEHLVSIDQGVSFQRIDTAIRSSEGTPESGVFDVHPIGADGACYLVYSAMSQDLQGLRWNPEAHADVRGPDVHLAVSRSGTWDGPWERRGVILRQEEVPWHAALGHPAHEWGLEGPQLLALPDGRFLMSAVCFLGNRPRFQRQRLFWAIADDIAGPYRMIGFPIEPQGDGWESAEVGHGTLVVAGDEVWQFYQARSRHLRDVDQGETQWRYGAAAWRLSELLQALRAA